jgi:mannose-6-phosphate isomerase-like protein (cupin superfamily)
MLLIAALLAAASCAAGDEAQPAKARAMVVVNEEDVKVEEAPPHGNIGMSTAYRISDAAPARALEFRKRVLHPGAAVGAHRNGHDEVYYVLSGRGEVVSDGETAELGPGMAAYFYDGASVGIRQIGDEPLAIIIAYPITRLEE